LSHLGRARRSAEICVRVWAGLAPIPMLSSRLQGHNMARIIRTRHSCDIAPVPATASSTSPSRSLLITMAVTGYAGFRQSRRPRLQIFCRVPVVRGRRGCFLAGNIQPGLPEMNCDRYKSAPVARDWIKESRCAVRIGGPRFAAGGRCCRPMGPAGATARPSPRCGQPPAPASAITVRDCTVEPADHDGLLSIVGCHDQALRGHDTEVIRLSGSIERVPTRLSVFTPL
jgi:hypothetical protein